MPTRKKGVVAAEACMFCAGEHGPRACPIVIAVGAANAASIQELGSAGAPSALQPPSRSPAPPRSPGPPAAEPRVRTEAQKARRKAQRAKYKEKHKSRVRQTPHHGGGMSRKENASEDLKPKEAETSVPEGNSVGQGEDYNDAEGKIGKYRVDMKPSRKDWYDIDQEDQEAEAHKTSQP
ncbi:hypothetical protein N7454_000244 [Penicillium verhagenii]|nr:hypothetical protein N7454_000244 [Penicillium verhagenii]